MSSGISGTFIAQNKAVVGNFELIQEKVKKIISSAGLTVESINVFPQDKGFLALVVLAQSFLLIQAKTDTDELYMELKIDSEGWRRHETVVGAFYQIADLYKASGLKTSVF